MVIVGARSLPRVYRIVVIVVVALSEVSNLEGVSKNQFTVVTELKSEYRNRIAAYKSSSFKRIGAISSAFTVCPSWTSKFDKKRNCLDCILASQVVPSVINWKYRTKSCSIANKAQIAEYYKFQPSLVF